MPDVLEDMDEAIENQWSEETFGDESHPETILATIHALHERHDTQEQLRDTCKERDEAPKHVNDAEAKVDTH